MYKLFCRTNYLKTYLLKTTYIYYLTVFVNQENLGTSYLDLYGSGSFLRLQSRHQPGLWTDLTAHLGQGGGIHYQALSCGCRQADISSWPCGSFHKAALKMAAGFSQSKPERKRDKESTRWMSQSFVNYSQK